MFVSFWVSVLKQAALRSDENQTPVEWAAKAALVLLGLLSPTLFQALTGVNVPTWMQSAPPIGYVVVYAPYLVWRREHDALAALQERTQTRLRLGTTTATFRHNAKRVAQVWVRNDGIEQVKNCTGRLVNIYRLIGDNRVSTEYPPMYLRWALGDGGGKYNTFQSEAYLDVFQIEKPYQGGLVMVGAPSDYETHLQAAIPETDRCIFRIELAAENCARVVLDFIGYVEPLGQHAPRDGYGDFPDTSLPMIEFRLI